jgi:hypothetical protein
MNYGNSGQRYKMPKCVSVEIDAGRNGVLATYECGHSVLVKPYSTLDRLYEIVSRRIGKRQRCYDCEVAHE